MAGAKRRRAPAASAAKAATLGAKRRRKAATSPAAAVAPPSWVDCAHLIESVSRFLALADVLQCRLVCKNWHQILSPIQRIRRKFCCSTHESMEDVLWLRPERGDTHVCPPPTMKRAPEHPDALCWMSTMRMQIWGNSMSCKLVSSAHGLLCFHLQRYQGRPLVLVVNPATGQHRLLPTLLCIVDVESVGMHSNQFDKSYTVIVVGKASTTHEYFHDDGNPVKKPYYVAHVEIYYSKTGQWEHHSHFITDAGVQKGWITWWQERFHWIVHKHDRTLWLLAYDMQKRTWVETTVQSLSTRGLGNANALLNWKGSLLTRFPFSQYSRYWRVSWQDNTWKPALFSTKKPMSMHIVAHFLKDPEKLQVCIYDPYSFGPAENTVLSSRSYIVHEKRELNGPCFAFSPCMSMEV